MLSSRNGGATFLLPGDLLSSMQTRTITKVPAFAAKNTSGTAEVEGVNREQGAFIVRGSGSDFSQWPEKTLCLNRNGFLFVKVQCK